mmetsp:Transcript_17327/g.37843  ORF Transcript_17327/g.37843 Transcript_17327/m.37843 type:complete len:195 (+) Transcript_17327:292-876(+)
MTSWVTATRWPRRRSGSSIETVSDFSQQEPSYDSESERSYPKTLPKSKFRRDWRTMAPFFKTALRGKTGTGPYTPPPPTPNANGAGADAVATVADAEVVVAAAAAAGSSMSTEDSGGIAGGEQTCLYCDSDLHTMHMFRGTLKGDDPSKLKARIRALEIENKGLKDRNQKLEKGLRDQAAESAARCRELGVEIQ